MSLSIAPVAAPPLSSDAIPGYGALFQSGPPSNATASAQAQAPQNPYEQAYQQSVVAENVQLLQSLSSPNSGPLQSPSYALAASGNVLSQTGSTLSALQQGLAAGFFSGTGVDTLA